MAKKKTPAKKPAKKATQPKAKAKAKAKPAPKAKAKAKPKAKAKAKAKAKPKAKPAPKKVAAAKQPAVKKPAAAKQPAAAKPASAAAAAADPIELAKRDGTRAAEEFDGEPGADEAAQQELGWDAFLNQGGFDAIPGSTEDRHDAIKAAFIAAFVDAMHVRFGSSSSDDEPVRTGSNGAPAAEDAAEDDAGHFEPAGEDAAIPEIVDEDDGD